MNARIGGFFPEELVTIAAAPAMGKTGLAVTLADWIAAKHGTVAFFTLEMSPFQYSVIIELGRSLFRP